MAEKTCPAIDLTPHWADLNDHLIELVDMIPEDKMNWSPSPELWNFRGTLLHAVGGRLGWLTYTVKDGGDMANYMERGRTTGGLKELLRESWARLEAFLSVREKLDAVYDHSAEQVGDWPYIDPPVTDGHYIAYHRFVHDVEHRGDILRLLAQLGIDPMAQRRRRPL